MPQQVNKRRQRKKKSRLPAREPTYGQMYSKVSRDVRWLMSVVNVEDKYVDVANAGLVITTTPTLTLLCPLSLGTSSVTRLGQSIKTVSLQLVGAIRRDLTQSQQRARLTVVTDRQCLAAAPAYTDVFDSNDPIGRRNVGYLDRFSIVLDKLFVLSAAGPDMFIFNENIKLGTHIKFNTGNAGTIADITENSFYALWVSDTAAAGPVTTTSWRLNFVDN